jgi:hypothetical protein
MPKLSDVCRHIRSKNAGPFWITVDLFFKDEQAYRAHARDPNISPELFSTLYGANPASIKFIPVDSLNVLKISYPRSAPQGWRGERDMHGGQQFAALLDVELIEKI